MSESGVDHERALEDASSDRVTTVFDLKKLMREFVEERNWQEFHNAKNLSMSLAIEASELMEHFQWLTSEEVTNRKGFDRSEVADELADVVCYALSFANSLEIDVSEAIRDKMIRNRQKYPASDASGEPRRRRQVDG